MDICINGKERVVDCTIWNHSESTRVLIIAPAIGVSRRFYRTIATYFYSLSYSVISLDYYGMVEHKHPGEEKLSLSDWGCKDIDSVIGYANEQFPDQELYFLGHSIAGQIFPLAERSSKIKAAFLVASQNVSQTNWSGFAKFKVNLFWHVIVPFCVGMFGHLPAVGYGGKYPLHKSIAQEWAKWGKSSSGILSQIPQAPIKYKNLDVPTKFLSFSDDAMLAPVKAVGHLYESYGSPIKHHEHICPKEIGMSSIGHFKFFKKECRFLWTKVDSWFNQVNKSQSYDS